jgi:hypothetical protein
VVADQPEAGHERWHDHHGWHRCDHHEHVHHARAGRGGAGNGRLGVVRRDRAVVVLQALSSGTIETAFQKAPDFARIPVTWNMEIPSGGTQPFNTFTAGVARG